MSLLLEPVQPAFTNTETAVQDFEWSSNEFYDLLYIEKTSGHPERDQCLRVTQQAEGHWKLSRYNGSVVKNSILIDTTLTRSLTTLKPGHYMPICTSNSTASVMGVLLIKHRKTTTFSMALDLVSFKQMSDTEQMLLLPAFNISQHLKRLSN